MCVFPVITHFPTTEMALVMKSIKEERLRQDDKWGEQNHPNGTGDHYRVAAAQARASCEIVARAGFLTWSHILKEEFFEAMAEEDPAKLREELVQVAAVAVSWIEAIDRGTQTNAS